jgi:CDP-glycerol glycerophosphotransferase (TagB/SpsB family)
MPAEPPRLPFQANGKPTVLYNPHVSPHLSSWYRHGRAVLEHFLRDDRTNLIFAPHVMLFHRRFVLTIDKLRIDRPGLIDQRVLDAPNIHVDLGSRACTDMTYTAAADIYLGDVSSQVYEFLHQPRPCLFLNSHGVDWQGDANYAHWQAGPVIEGPQDLGDALDRAVAEHSRYLPVQRELFRRSFDLTDEPSASRAARAVLAALDRPTVRSFAPLHQAPARSAKQPDVAAV